MLRAALVHHARTTFRRNPRHRERHHFIQNPRAEAAAENQQIEQAGPPRKALLRRGDRGNLVSHRIAGDEPLVARRHRRAAVESAQHACGQRRQHACGKQSVSIGVHQYQRHAERASREPRRNRHVATCREDDLRRSRAHQAAALPQRAQQQKAAQQQCLQTFAAQPTEVDRIEVDTVPLDKATLHAGLGAEPAHRPSAPAQRLSNGESRHHVPARPSSDDDEMTHALPPRMRTLFSRSTRSRMAIATRVDSSADPP